MRGDHRIGKRAERVVRRAAAPRRRRRAPRRRWCPSRRAAIERGLVDDGAARRIHEVGAVGFIRPSSRAPIEPARPLARARGESDTTSERASSSSLGDQGGACLGRALGGEVLAPRQHRPSKGAPDPRRARAQMFPGRGRRTSCRSGRGRGSLATSPRVSRGPRRECAASATRISPHASSAVGYGSPAVPQMSDAAIGRRLHVDGRVAHSRGDQELEAWAAARGGSAETASAREAP